MSVNNTSMLNNFVRLLTLQIDKYSDYSENDEYIERLFSGFGRACTGLKRMIGVEEVAKYERIRDELRVTFEAKKRAIADARV